MKASRPIRQRDRRLRSRRDPGRTLAAGVYPARHDRCLGSLPTDALCPSTGCPYVVHTESTAVHIESTSVHGTSIVDPQKIRKPSTTCPQEVDFRLPAPAVDPSKPPGRRRFSAALRWIRHPTGEIAAINTEKGRVLFPATGRDWLVIQYFVAPSQGWIGVPSLAKVR